MTTTFSIVPYAANAGLIRDITGMRRKRVSRVFLFWIIHYVLVYANFNIVITRASRAAMPSWRKETYFITGFIGTFFVNILRLVLISTLAVNVGMGAARMFHDYYGEPYFITWMIAYLLMVFTFERYIKQRSEHKQLVSLRQIQQRPNLKRMCSVRKNKDCLSRVSWLDQ